MHSQITDPVTLLAFVGAALAIAKVLGGIAERFGVPAVLAELAVGFVLGNLPSPFLQHMRESHFVHSLAELGVLVLLFVVGLETDLKAIVRVGFEAVKVAVAGVVAPMALASVGLLLLHDTHYKHILFISAALTATSIGITVRVLQGQRRLHTDSGQVILGASVLDDILGLLILTVVSSIVERGVFEPSDVMLILGEVTGFLFLIWLARRFAFEWIFEKIRKLDVQGSATVLALSLCLGFSWVAQKMGLAPILGAFALGVALDDAHFSGYRDTRGQTLEQLIRPVTDFFTPIFFVSMGMSISLAAFESREGILLSVVLSACAILGKLACALAVRRPSVDRWLVGLGMLPRGEVGLIFAAVGLRIGVFSDTDYSAVVFVVAITTLLAPILLQYRFRNERI